MQPGSPTFPFIQSRCLLLRPEPQDLLQVVHSDHSSNAAGDFFEHSVVSVHFREYINFFVLGSHFVDEKILDFR